MSQEFLSLRRDQADLFSLLYEGTLLRHGEKCVALPREAVIHGREVESIIFELVRSSDFNPPPQWKMGIQAIRPATLMMTVFPMGSVFLYGASRGWSLNPWEGLCAFLGVICFQISVNILNDVEDHLRLIDLPGTLGGSGVLQKGWVSARKLKMFGYFALALGTFLGLPAVIRLPKTLLGMGAIGLMGVLTYSNRPVGMKYRAWGDLWVFSLLGPFLGIGFAEAIFGKWDLPFILLGTIFGFLSWGAIHANHLYDAERDRVNGVSTLASRLGFKKARRFLMILYGMTYIWVFGGILSGMLPMTLGLSVSLAMPWTIHFFRRLYQASGPASALLGSVRFLSTRLYWIWGMLIWIGLAIWL